MLANTWWPFSHTNSDNSVLVLTYKSLMIKDAEHFPREFIQNPYAVRQLLTIEIYSEKNATLSHFISFERTHTNRDHVLWLILRNHCHVGGHWSVIWCMNRNFSKVSVQVFFIIKVVSCLIVEYETSFYILAMSLYQMYDLNLFSYKSLVCLFF